MRPPNTVESSLVTVNQGSADSVERPVASRRSDSPPPTCCRSSENPPWLSSGALRPRSHDTSCPETAMRQMAGDRSVTDVPDVGTTSVQTSITGTWG
jgi:hypothetical protein